ncbi:hypothetical protein [Tenacibaculum caenipelagi]|uniref:Acetyltransferase (GNAT) family protein n=1 Tax=Tenacibaculum caenipelagi TaxID=1325435 RepID=A0A4R6TLE8_9FLAO|nr:hypothetical protein [Tenacibaculum caenipelagi]TDQ30378.1 hypothetical protein DFQ07_0722 [Tenacibaculum caenipelagi]
MPSDYENDPIKAGKIKLHLYNYFFIDYGFGLYQAFDRLNETMRIGSVLLDYDTEELKEDIKEEIGDSFNNSILVIHEFMLYPKFRSKGYGKEILENIEIFFSGKCGYIALQSFPKQHDGPSIKGEEFKDFQFEKLNKNFKESQKRLDLFYENCGFNKIKSKTHSFYIKNVNPLY